MGPSDEPVKPTLRVLREDGALITRSRKRRF
jgi:hypothetical protein